MRRRMTFRFDSDVALVDYVRECWPEHARRIGEMRRGSRLVRFYYPLIGFVISFAVMGGITLLVTALSRQNLFASDDPNARGQWVQEMLVSSVPVMWVATALVVGFVIVTCLAAGASKAREMLFTAEKLEMKVRKEYYQNFEYSHRNAASLVGGVAGDSRPGSTFDGAVPISRRPEGAFDPRA